MVDEQSNPSTKSIKICFVALTAYPLLAGKNADNIIGPDVHQLILAKELIKHDFKISFITYGEGGASVEYINGMEIIKIQRDVCRLRVVNIISKVFHIWNAARKANARVYVHTGGATTSLFCRLTGKKFVCNIASDAMVNRKLITRKIREFNRSRISIYAFGNLLDIKLADAVIVQNEYQKRMLKKNFGKDGFLIKKPFPLTEQGMSEKANPPIVLWVGAMAEVKQPELFVRLAEAIPDVRFQMIGGHSGNQGFYNRIKARSKRIPNFEFLGVIPFNEVDKYFSRASILVNTSMFEGFPHAFIQAWMHYVPVVSLSADPDEIICNWRLGLHSETFHQLVEDVKILINNETLREEMGVNGRAYVESEHDVTKNVLEYVDVFDYVMRC